ncbi:MAG: peptide deformylase [Bacteroidales bacterium]|jgi:peptide deformylase|nr:peptide deformylase [Bacteroidales bacterium]
MNYPIYLYGSPVLRKVAADIDKDYNNLFDLIENMWSTMYHSDGVGLAAPQIGKSIRLFVIDATPMADEDPSVEGLKKVFINAHITEREGDKESFNEGCLSIPGIREDVVRPTRIRMKYVDENFEEHDEWFEGIAARVIQHEYDHLDGVMFVDHLNPLKKKLLSGKLKNISKGKVKVDYKVKM